MHIAIDLDDDLIKTAFELSGIKSEQVLIEQAIKELIKNHQSSALVKPNKQTKAAMLDIRAKKNLETITLEQLQHDYDAQ